MRKYKQGEIFRSKLTNEPIKVSKVVRRNVFDAKDDLIYITDLDPKSMNVLRGTGREVLADSIRRRYQ